MRTARSTAAISGLLIALLGVWGAVIPFLGPSFDYSFGVNETWRYTTDRLWLDIVPGAVALAGGLLLLFAAKRATLLTGALLALTAGAWFVLGPAVSLTWESAPGPIGRPLFDSTRQALELVGYFYGLGAVIVGLAAFSAGRVWTRSARPASEATGAVEHPAPPAQQEPLAAPTRPEPRSRRLLRRRRRPSAEAQQQAQLERRR